MLRVRRETVGRTGLELKIKSSALDMLLRWHLGCYKAGNIYSGRQLEAAVPLPPQRLFQQALWFEFSALASFSLGNLGFAGGHYRTSYYMLHMDVTLQPQISKLTAEEAVNREEGGRCRSGHF